MEKTKQKNQNETKKKTHVIIWNFVHADFWENLKNIQRGHFLL